MDGIEKIFPRFDEKGTALVNAAYSIAEEALKGRVRSNGHPFIEHPDGVAKIAYD